MQDMYCKWKCIREWHLAIIAMGGAAGRAEELTSIIIKEVWEAKTLMLNTERGSRIALVEKLSTGAFAFVAMSILTNAVIINGTIQEYYNGPYTVNDDFLGKACKKIIHIWGGNTGPQPI